MTQWSLEKPRRIKNRRVLDEIKKLRCCVCNKAGPNDPHHLRSVGSGGEDSLTNCISLCRNHHSQMHQYGPLKMFDLYPVFKEHILSLGWMIENGKLKFYK